MAELYGRTWKRKELVRLVGSMDQVAGIRQFEAVEGLERGSRALQVWTGSGLTFNVLAERALDLGAFQYKGMPLNWRSAVGEAHPAFYDPTGIHWLRSFGGGMLVTCGLDHFGAPGRDSGQDFGLHGRVSNLPARAVGCRAEWAGDEYELEVSGQVRQAQVFGENILLRRRLSTRLGSNRVQIEDTVTNEGFAPQPHMLLYHFNTGFPLLTAAARLELEVSATEPRDDDAKAGLADWRTFQTPAPGYREQVFIHTPVPDKQGRGRAEVLNPEMKLGLRLSFDAAALPYLMEWKMMGEGLYVLGIEPSNCRTLGGRAAARAGGLLPELAAGESRTYRLELEVVEMD
jgi:hypothetical protein